MAEDANPPQTENPTKDEGEKKITFTKEQQEFFDKAISERLARQEESWKKKQEAEAQKRAEAERISKLEGEEKLKATYEAQLKELRESNASVSRELRLSEARSELSQAGLDIKFAEKVVGSTLEETKASVEALRKMVEEQVTARMNATAAKGQPQNPNGADGSNAIKDIIFRGAGLTKQ